MHPSRTRMTLTLAALAVAASACSSPTGAQPSAGDASNVSPTAEAHDTAALRAGADWLNRQVENGVVHNDQYGFDDYGLGIDVALALHTVGQQSPTVQAVGDQLARHVGEYTAPGFGTVTSAGGTAKAVALAGAVGADPSTFGGMDLVAQLEKTVADSGPATGRIQDVLDPKEAAAADYANVVGQAYAVLGLTAVNSPEAGPATQFLLAQQCTDGWFRLDFTKDVKAADQSCEGDKGAKPDLDTTAFAIRALSLSDSPQASNAVSSAVAWLSGQQAPDGSFGGGSTASTPNTNSTGLAGTALGEAGETEAAEQAATWVFGRQALDCEKFEPAVVGAIAYDDAGVAAAARKGVGVKTADQFRRASAGALPVLQWLPTRETTDRKVGSC